MTIRWIMATTAYMAVARPPLTETAEIYPNNVLKGYFSGVLCKRLNILS